jgi:hypothetical protein
MSQLKQLETGSSPQSFGFNLQRLCKCDTCDGRCHTGAGFSPSFFGFPLPIEIFEAHQTVDCLQVSKQLAVLYKQQETVALTVPPITSQSRPSTPFPIPCLPIILPVQATSSAMQETTRPSSVRHCNTCCRFPWCSRSASTGGSISAGASLFRCKVEQYHLTL